MLLEMLRQREGVRTVAIHAYGQRLQRLRQQPGVERAHGGAGVPREEAAVGDVRRITDNRTTERPSLSVDVLGGRMGHDVRAKRERPLQIRRGEAVVDHQRNAACCREVAEPAEIDQLEPGVRRGLDKDQFRRGTHQALPRARIGGIGIIRRHAPLGQNACEDLVGRPEQGTRRQDVIAR